MQRYTFKFFNFKRYEERSILIIGQHYDEAKVAAWTVLGEQEHDRAAVRDTWRLVSTVQQPVWAWVRDETEVAS